MKHRIFVLDDEPQIVRIASDLLKEEGYFVTSSSQPLAALKEITANPPDLLLMDVRMPGKSGIEICKEIRSNPKLKHLVIVMMSVKIEESDVVLGLEMGADEYISKPIRGRELLARVRTVLRRKSEPREAANLTVGPLSLDFEKYAAFIDGKKLKLTPKEFELLAFFVRNTGKVLTRQRISEAVWGTEYSHSSRTIDFYAHQLRKKLGAFGACVQGLKGVGYMFDFEGQGQ